MRTKVTISFLFIILLFLGCKKDETPTQPACNPYAGDYVISFRGTVGVRGDSSENSETQQSQQQYYPHIVDSDGKFSWKVGLTITSSSYDAHPTWREIVI